MWTNPLHHDDGTAVISWTVMLESVTAFLTAHQLPAVFAGSFFFGDSVLLTTAYLAGQLHWSVVPIFLTALLGTVVSDSLWYFFGMFAARRFSNVRFLRKEREKMSGFVARLVGERPLIALIMVKFLYGSRIAMILYSAARGLGFGTFTFFNTIGAIVWLLVFIPLGYAAGRGVAHAAPFLHAIPAALAVLVASIVAFRLLTVWMERKTQQK